MLFTHFRSDKERDMQPIRRLSPEQARMQQNAINIAAFLSYRQQCEEIDHEEQQHAERTAIVPWYVFAGWLMLAVVWLFLPSLANGQDHPRYPRVVFVTGKSCPPCKAALKDFPPWLRKSGWQVDETSRAHVQIVSIEEREDLVELFGVSLVPAMVLLTDDGKHSKPVTYTGRKSLLRMFEHSHLCTHCNVEWWHGAEAASNPRAHNCPRCGRAEFVVHREAGQ